MTSHPVLAAGRKRQFKAGLKGNKTPPTGPGWTQEWIAFAYLYSPTALSQVFSALLLLPAHFETRYKQHIEWLLLKQWLSLIASQKPAFFGADFSQRNEKLQPLALLFNLDTSIGRSE